MAEKALGDTFELFESRKCTNTRRIICQKKIIFTLKRLIINHLRNIQKIFCILIFRVSLNHFATATVVVEAGVASLAVRVYLVLALDV
jgi:hypothetical protein